MAYLNACVSRHLKQELTWAIDKWFWFISTTMLFKTVIPVETVKNLKNKAILN